jgi:hypothetical protein
MAHVRQTRPDSSLGLPTKVLKASEVGPTRLGIGYEVGQITWWTRSWTGVANAMNRSSWQESLVLSVEGWGLRVEGWGLRVEGRGSRVEGFGMGVERWVLRVECSVMRLRDEGWGMKLRSRVEGWGLRVEGFKSMVECWVLADCG